jgi:hypothetical protein
VGKRSLIPPKIENEIGNFGELSHEKPASALALLLLNPLSTFCYVWNWILRLEGGKNVQ